MSMMDRWFESRGSDGKTTQVHLPCPTRQTNEYGQNQSIK